MNKQIIDALLDFSVLTISYSELEREPKSQLEYELRDAIINSCRKIEKVVKEAK